MRGPGSSAIKNAYAIHQYAKQGPEGRAAAAAELFEHVIANPKVQNEFAQVAAEGTGIAFKVAGDVIPQFFDTAQKVSGKTEGAIRNAIQAVLDEIPIVDQIEGVGQGLLAVDRGIAAATQTGVGVIKAATTTVNDLGETAANFQQNIAELSTTADQVMKSDVNQSRVQQAITSPKIPTPYLTSPTRPPRPALPQQTVKNTRTSGGRRRNTRRRRP
jgi:hypothetical protein